VIRVLTSLNPCSGDKLARICDCKESAHVTDVLMQLNVVVRRFDAVHGDLQQLTRGRCCSHILAAPTLLARATKQSNNEMQPLTVQPDVIVLTTSPHYVCSVASKGLGSRCSVWETARHRLHCSECGQRTYFASTPSWRSKPQMALCSSVCI
jgi:hypothetical protein